jgi:hypothetical protein
LTTNYFTTKMGTYWVDFAMAFEDLDNYRQTADTGISGIHESVAASISPPPDRQSVIHTAQDNTAQDNLQPRTPADRDAYVIDLVQQLRLLPRGSELVDRIHKILKEIGGGGPTSG